LEFLGKKTILVDFLNETNFLKESPLTVVDVGCSGGVSSAWSVYKDHKILGIDPVVDECERLNSIKNDEQIFFQDAFVILGEDHPFKIKKVKEGKNSYWGGNTWERLSASLGANILNERTAKDEPYSHELNNWREKRHSTNFLTLEEVCKRNNFLAVDFIKIDVDGPDLEVLLSGEGLIASSPVLGLAIEVNYFGGTSELDSTFHNVDRKMRELGFDLYDLTLRKYSSASFPAKFEFKCVAQTISGRPYQGDALYFRDPCSKGLNNGAPNCPELNLISQYKLASMYELFGMPDQAVELLLQMQIEDKVKSFLLEKFTTTYSDFTSYDDLISGFQKNPLSFYPK
jgi:FkbM family methyltransferase